MTELRRVEIAGEISTLNSTAAPAGLLGIGGVFLGTAEEPYLKHSSISVTVYSDVDSAVDGLKVEWSHDGVEWHVGDEYTYNSGKYKIFAVQPHDRYMRVRYTNGAAPQTLFHITTLFRPGITARSHRLEDALSGQDDAALTKAVVAGRAPDGTYQNVNADATGSLNIAFGDTANLDAFSRQRVSNPDTVFDSTFLYDKQPLVFEEILAAAGAATHVPNEATVRLATTGAGDDAALQSYEYIPYIPGKSTVLYQTFVMKTAVAGVVKRCGLFDVADGIFLEQDGTNGLYLVRRSSVSGAPVDDRYLQSAWNLDTFDGDGVSGIDLDITKGQILAMDLQWLGMGRVRVGFDIDGRFWPAHQFLNANNLATVYMRRATLPVRWEIDGDSAANFDAVCASIQSEGGADKFFTYQHSTASAARTAPNGAREPLVAIRSALLFSGEENRISTRILNMSSMQTSNGSVLFELLYVPDPADITGGAWANHDAAYSGLESNLTATAVANAIPVASWFSQATNQAKMAAQQGVSARYQVSLDAAGTTPHGAWVLAATGLGGAETVYGALDWEEIR